MTTPLLFISGAGLPAWVWDGVREGLSAPAAVAPRPAPGAGTVSDYARAALAAAPGGAFTVVAHSSGGVIATDLVRLAPGRVTGVLGIAAVIPAAGGSFTSSLPFPHRVVLPLVLRLAGTRPPASAVRKGLASDLDESIVQRLIADIEPEPRSYFTSRTQPSDTLQAVPRRGYVVAADDAELPPALQRRFASRLRATQLSEVPCGHLPMLADPAAVRSAIHDFTERIGSTA